jgi:glycosyltransferase involved in cell wall biosynthesis
MRQLDGAVAAADFIAEGFPRNVRRAVVRNLPLDEEIDVTPAARRPEAGLFVYVGGVSRTRGIEILLQAIEKLPPPARLELAGPIQDPGLDEAIGASRRTTYHYFLERPQARELLSRATAAVVLFQPLPNYLNAGPNKIFEYMAAGVPFLASDFPAWRRLLDEVGCARFITPSDPAAVAEALHWFDAHPDEARAMGRRGHDAARQHFRWSAEFEKVLDLYRGLGVANPVESNP